MFRNITTAVALAAVALFTTAAVAPAASADTRPCMSQKEFRAITKGMSLARIATIVGSRGHQDATSSAGGYTASVRSWKTCTPYGAASVSFMNGRMSAKAGVFV